jgi:hypothetical protein
LSIEIGSGVSPTKVALAGDNLTIWALPSTAWKGTLASFTFDADVELAGRLSSTLRPLDGSSATMIGSDLSGLLRLNIDPNRPRLGFEGAVPGGFDLLELSFSF